IRQCLSRRELRDGRQSATCDSEAELRNSQTGVTMTARMKIWGVPLSVHTRKVILAARIKGIPHDVTPVIPVIPDNPPPNWRSLSPTGLIPAIDDDGYILSDSTAILLYLERKVPEPALLPAKLEDYGRALSIDGWAGDVLFRRIGHPVFFNQVVSPGI